MYLKIRDIHLRDLDGHKLCLGKHISGQGTFKIIFPHRNLKDFHNAIPYIQFRIVHIPSKGHDHQLYKYVT